jgi:hypothetical protein
LDKGEFLGQYVVWEEAIPTGYRDNIRARKAGGSVRAYPKHRLTLPLRADNPSFAWREPK